jgi:hypothetical protein
MSITGVFEPLVVMLVLHEVAVLCHGLGVRLHRFIPGAATTLHELWLPLVRKPNELQDIG